MREEWKALANSLAKDSIVTQALTRFVEQIIETCADKAKHAQIAAVEAMRRQRDDAIEYRNAMIRERDEALAAWRERGEALKPFDWPSEGLSPEDLIRDRICDWFGPSDFLRARAALNGKTEP
jgi:hypothetical protein